MDKVEEYVKGNFKENGSTYSVDLDVVDMSSDSWTAKSTDESKAQEVFNGIKDGFTVLKQNVPLIEGFRVTFYDIDHVFTGENSWSDLSSALNNNGFCESKHYHVIYDGSVLPTRVGSYHWTRTDDGTMWHDTKELGLSGLSLSTTRVSLADAYVRGFHQLMHNYINEDIAVEYATTDNGYDAIHQLGTGTSEGRSLMADTHPHRAVRGHCSQSLRACLTAPHSIFFSDCTINAVKRSIFENE